MITVAQFCKLHKADPSWTKHAVANYKTGADAWARLPGEYLVWVATRPGVLNKEDEHRFNLFCYEQLYRRSMKTISIADDRDYFFNRLSERVLENRLHQAWKALKTADYEEQAKWLRANCKPTFRGPYAMELLPNEQVRWDLK